MGSTISRLLSFGMSNGNTQWGQTALWVNWGDNWGKAGDYAWFVKRTGEMFCLKLLVIFMRTRSY